MKTPMTITIDRDRAMRALRQMVEELAHCEPDRACEMCIGVSGAHCYAHELGIITDEQLRTMTRLVASVARRSAMRAAEPVPEAAP